jgi:hypothetical protein
VPDSLLCAAADSKLGFFQLHLLMGHGTGGSDGGMKVVEQRAARESFAQEGEKAWRRCNYGMLSALRVSSEPLQRPSVGSWPGRCDKPGAMQWPTVQGSICWLPRLLRRKG